MMQIVKRNANSLKAMMLIAVLSVLSACVTTSNSSLTDKADPKLAVERYVQLGLEYIRREDFQRARKHLTRALEINPESVEANSVLALVYGEEGETKQAEALYLKAIELDETYTRGRSYYAAFLFAQGRVEEALAQFQVAVNDIEYEGRSQIFSNIALCYIKLDKTSEAIEAYRQTLRLDRTNGRALSGITELYVKSEDFDNAQRYYNRLVRLIRDNGMKHSAQSLWQGIRIARHFGSIPQARALANLLNDMYPNSAENAKAKSIMDTSGLSKIRYSPNLVDSVDFQPADPITIAHKDVFTSMIYCSESGRIS